MQISSKKRSLCIKYALQSARVHGFHDIFTFLPDATCGYYPLPFAAFDEQTEIFSHYTPIRPYIRGDFYICLLGFWPSGAKTLRGRLQINQLARDLSKPKIDQCTKLLIQCCF